MDNDLTKNSNNGKYAENDEREELQKSKEIISQLEIELSAVRALEKAYEARLTEERSKISLLEHENAKLQQALTNAQECQVIDVVEAPTLCSEFNVFYQSEIEYVLKAFVQDCKAQLTVYVEELEAELQAKETYLLRKAINRCRAYAESHKERIMKMEEEFKNEVKSLTSKLQESKKKRKDAEFRLQKEITSRTQTVLQLYCIMEKYWRQTAKIILSFISIGNVPKPWQEKSKKLTCYSSRKIINPECTREKTDKRSDVVRLINASEWSFGLSESTDDTNPNTKDNFKRPPKRKRIVFTESGCGQSLISSTSSSFFTEDELTTSTLTLSEHCDRTPCNCTETLLLVLSEYPEDDDKENGISEKYTESYSHIVDSRKTT